VQKIGAQYIGKRIVDQLMAPPAPPPEAGAAVQDLDGQVIRDEHEQPIGTAYRLPEIAVYVVAQGRAESVAELERCVGDPESRLFLQRDGDRITGLIYAPDPARVPRRAEGMRADEV
jgi:hypothetical protein